MVGVNARAVNSASEVFLFVIFIKVSSIILSWPSFSSSCLALVLTDVM